MASEMDVTTLGEGPLAGLRVLEVGVWHAGPGAAAILGDLGAEVVKVESPQGDPGRFHSNFGPMTDTSAWDLPEWSVMFEMSNRNKRGICVDLRTAEGRAVVAELVDSVDVLVTNLRQETKVKYGLDYQSLSARNPGLVQLGVTGFGARGERAGDGAFDTLGQAVSGMMMLTGSQAPVPLMAMVLDQMAAIAGSHGVMAALVARQRDGLGQEVEASLYGSATWLGYANLIYTSVRGQEIDTTWHRGEQSPLSNTFRCSDGKWVVSTNNPESRYWPSLCRALGREDLLVDPAHETDDQRRAARPHITRELDRTFAERPRNEWLSILHSHGLSFGPIQGFQDVLADPQALANGYVQEVNHPDLGRLVMPGYPISFSRDRAGAALAAPGLGQHTREVLAEAGFDEARIAALEEAGTVATAPEGQRGDQQDRAITVGNS